MASKNRTYTQKEKAPREKMQSHWYLWIGVGIIAQIATFIGYPALIELVRGMDEESYLMTLSLNYGVFVFIAILVLSGAITSLEWARGKNAGMRALIASATLWLAYGNFLLVLLIATFSP